MTSKNKIIEKIRTELEKGITRNKVLPLDWAMDRISPIIEKALTPAEEEHKKEIEMLQQQVCDCNDGLLKYEKQIFGLGNALKDYKKENKKLKKEISDLKKQLLGWQHIKNMEELKERLK